ncbi:MAG: CinA family protein [Cellvibrionaceae bacterium]
MSTSSNQLTELTAQLAKHLVQRHWTVSAAESCTGGGVAHTFTALSGSSQWFEGGFVTYSNRMKTAMLGVDSSVLETCGAVSEAVVEQMAIGALDKSGANLSVAISGVAGPDGGTVEKPVGTVWFAWAVRLQKGSLRKSSLMKQNDQVGSVGCYCELHQLKGDRLSIREQAVVIAIKGLIEQIKKTPV